MKIKKIKKIIRPKSKQVSKPKYKLKYNPSITYEKELNRLVGEDVILYIFENAKWIRYSGILNKPTVLPKWYIFQFNPLASSNQNKYLLPNSEYDENHAIAALELEFLNNEPTYNYFFNLNNVVEIEDNIIYLQEPNGKFSEIV